MGNYRALPKTPALAASGDGPSLNSVEYQAFHKANIAIFPIYSTNSLTRTYVL